MPTPGSTAAPTSGCSDYRATAGRYDGIVSIEMIEAVGERYWPVYFAA